MNESRENYKKLIETLTAFTAICIVVTLVVMGICLPYAIITWIFSAIMTLITGFNGWDLAYAVVNKSEGIPVHITEI